jgi:hypothetical protein
MTSASTGGGHALAAPLYPGSVGGNPGATIKQFLGSHLPAQLADQLGMLSDPLKAEAYASGPNDASFPPGGPAQVLTDVAHVDADGGRMRATGTFVDAGALTSQAKSETTVTASSVMTTATSTLADISIAGLVHIGHVTSVANASSNATKATYKATTTFDALSVAGIPISIGAQGPAIGGLLNPLLGLLGVHLTFSPATHTQDAGKATVQAPALTISIAPPNNGGNTFTVIVGGAAASVDASSPFAFTSPPTAGGTLGLPAVQSPGVSITPAVETPAPVTSGTSSSSTPIVSQPIASLPSAPANSEHSKPVTVALALLGLAVGAAGAFGLGKVRDDVLAAAPVGDACPLERSER